MELTTPIYIDNELPKIHHSHQIMAVGSCFVENIGNQLENHGFSLRKNPFGILYHPMVILNSLQKMLQNKFPEEADILLHNERWHSWDFHSTFSDLEKNSALTKMKHSFELAHKIFPQLDFLILTFGTANGYRLKNGKLVANCHKYPANHFKKEMTRLNDLRNAWTEFIPRLKAHNPKLNILITVSPIRHKKDGLIENNRSKARCLLLGEALVKQFDYCHYFPAYEIQLDELRDYRFFAQDLVHPNKTAQEYIWEKFSEYAFDKVTIDLNQSILKLRKAANHKPFHPKSKAHQEFIEKQLENLSTLKKEFPEIKINDLKNQLLAQRI